MVLHYQDLRVVTRVAVQCVLGQTVRARDPCHACVFDGLYPALTLIEYLKLAVAVLLVSVLNYFNAGGQSRLAACAGIKG